MLLATDQSAVLKKTRELCETLLTDPEYVSVKNRIDTFLANDSARAQVDALMMKGQALQQKQQLGVQITAEEIADLETHQKAVMGNPVAKGFLDAQQEMFKLQDSVSQYVIKTFELGRVPGPEDMESSCGSGCGCH